MNAAYNGFLCYDTYLERIVLNTNPAWVVLRFFTNPNCSSLKMLLFNTCSLSLCSNNYVKPRFSRLFKEMGRNSTNALIAFFFGIIISRLLDQAMGILPYTMIYLKSYNNVLSNS